MKRFKVKLTNDEKLGLLIKEKNAFASIVGFFFLVMISVGLLIVFSVSVFDEIKFSLSEQIKETAIITDVWKKHGDGDTYYEYSYEFIVNSKKYQKKIILDELLFKENEQINILYLVNSPTNSKIEGSNKSIELIIGLLVACIVFSFFLNRAFLDVKIHYNYMQKVVSILENGIMIEAIQKEKTITEEYDDGNTFVTYHLTFEYCVSEDETKKYFIDIDKYVYTYEKLYTEVEQIVYSVSNPNLAILVKELPYSTYIEDRISKKN